MRYALATIGIIAIVTRLGSAQSGESDHWSPITAFLGSWTGEERGVPGVGRGERTYEFVIGGNFIHFRNTSRFEPQERNPEGEVHEDWGFYSYDTRRERIVLRQFFIEGFAIRYVLTSQDMEARRFIFVSEDVENAPPGFRARYTITFRNDDEFEEVFEVADPGKDFTELIRSDWSRVP